MESRLHTKSRIGILSSILVLLALIAITRLFFIQVLNVESFRDDANSSYVKDAPTLFDRGDIIMVDKDDTEISLATTVTGYTLALNPNFITDAESLYESLSTYIPLDHDSFINDATNKEDPYIEVARKLNKETRDKISEEGLDGVILSSENWRYYPGKSMSAHNVGFTAWKDNSLRGRYGLERFYDKELQAKDTTSRINIFAEIFSNIESEEESVNANLVTTLDPHIQSFLNDTLTTTMEKWDAEAIGGIIINPQTGAILAMDYLPSFDLNDFGSVSSNSVYANPFVENVFEFGSVIKPIIVAGALDVGAITADTSYYDGGFVVVEDKTIYNFDKKGRGQVTMQDVLNQSLNTGMVMTYFKMGKDNFRNYIYSFGLGEKTGIDLPNETTGLLGNLRSPRDLEYATAAFGQGIAMTPMEAVRGFSVLANGGVLITPHLGEKLVYPDEEVALEFPTGRRVIKESSSNEITRMLVEVVDSSLGEGSYKLDHYSIAAKTGTGQIPNPAGGYYDDRNLHSLFGYFPAYDPEFLMLVYIKYPKGVKYASQSVAPSFMETARFLLSYYDVPPDR